MIGCLGRSLKNILRSQDSRIPRLKRLFGAKRKRGLSSFLKRSRMLHEPPQGNITDDMPTKRSTQTFHILSLPESRYKKAVSLLQLTACFCCGAPEEIRTPGLQVRSLLLYPAELRARREGVLIEMRTACQQSWGKKTNFFERLLRGAVSGRHLVGSPILEDLLKKHSIPYADIDRMLAEPRLAFQILKKRPSPPPLPAYLHKNKTAPPEDIRRGGSLVVTESPIYWAAGVPRRQRSRAS